MVSSTFFNAKPYFPDFKDFVFKNDATEGEVDLPLKLDVFKPTTDHAVVWRDWFHVYKQNSYLLTCVRMVCTVPPSPSTAACSLKPFLPEKLHLPKCVS